MVAWILLLFVSSSLSQFQGVQNSIWEILRIDNVLNSPLVNSTSVSRTENPVLASIRSNGSQTNTLTQSTSSSNRSRFSNRRRISQRTGARSKAGLNSNPSGTIRAFRSSFRELQTPGSMNHELERTLDEILNQNIENQILKNPFKAPDSHVYILVNDAQGSNVTVPEFYLIKYEKGQTNNPVMKLISPECMHNSILNTTSGNTGIVDSVFSNPNCSSPISEAQATQSSMNEIINIINRNTRQRLVDSRNSGSSLVTSILMPSKVSPLQEIISPTLAPRTNKSPRNEVQPSLLDADPIFNTLQPLLFDAFNNIKGLPNSATAAMEIINAMSNLQAKDPPGFVLSSSSIPASPLRSEVLRRSERLTTNSGQSSLKDFVSLVATYLGINPNTRKHLGSPNAPLTASQLDLIKSSISTIVQYYQHLNGIPKTTGGAQSQSSPRSQKLTAQTSSQRGQTVSSLISVIDPNASASEGIKLHNFINSPIQSSINSILSLNLRRQAGNSAHRPIHIQNSLPATNSHGYGTNIGQGIDVHHRNPQHIKILGSKPATYQHPSVVIYNPPIHKPKYDPLYNLGHTSHTLNSHQGSYTPVYVPRIYDSPTYSNHQNGFHDFASYSKPAQNSWKPIIPKIYHNNEYREHSYDTPHSEYGYGYHRPQTHQAKSHYSKPSLPLTVYRAKGVRIYK